MNKAILFKGEAKGLQFQDNDLELMRNCLNSIETESRIIEGNAIELKDRLLVEIEESNYSDRILIYYTGHGIIRKKSFCLKVEGDTDSHSIISVESLISDIQIVSDGRQILLILDCCNAKGSFHAWTKYNSDNLFLFVPSKNLTNVKEEPGYHASVFTYFISEAIMSQDNDLFDGNELILQNLASNICKKVQEHNQNTGENIPIPELYGPQVQKYILGYRQDSFVKEMEYSIENYLNQFEYCITKCTQACFRNHQWCAAIGNTSGSMLKYLIPTVKEYSINQQEALEKKLDDFFETWQGRTRGRLGILGEMGVGKTSACLYLFYLLIQKYRAKTHNLIPIFIPLNVLEIENVSDETIIQVLSKYLDKYFNMSQVSYLIENGRVVFLLDGFDEISHDNNYTTILKNLEILKCFMRLPCKTVLTCRTHYFAEEDQLEEVLTGKISGTDFSVQLLEDKDFAFDIIEIQEFNDQEIQDLIILLCNQKEASNIWNSIISVYDLKDLAKRAILLKMILQTLPELKKKNYFIDSSVLYSVYTRNLLVREIRNRKVGLDIGDKEKFIGYVASMMYKQNTMSIGYHLYKKEFTNFFSNMSFTREEMNNADYDCRVATFFCRGHDDYYRFIHKSFYEFYMAKYCVSQAMDEEYDVWGIEWFPREIASFIRGIIHNNKKYHQLVIRLIQKALSQDDSTIVWNTLHIVSLLDEEDVREVLTDALCDTIVFKAKKEGDCVILRQYCRIIAKFIDRSIAEELIDQIIAICKKDDIQDKENDRTYTNYYGGLSAACVAFLRHLNVNEPKYDAKLHLYLLEHLATNKLVDRLIEVTNNWANRQQYQEAIDAAVLSMRSR